MSYKKENCACTNIIHPLIGVTSVTSLIQYKTLHEPRTTTRHGTQVRLLFRDWGGEPGNTYSYWGPWGSNLPFLKNPKIDFKVVPVPNLSQRMLLPMDVLSRTRYKKQVIWSNTNETEHSWNVL